jgi:hypothetical protein
MRKRQEIKTQCRTKDENENEAKQKKEERQETYLKQNIERCREPAGQYACLLLLQSLLETSISRGIHGHRGRVVVEVLQQRLGGLRVR